MRKLLLLTIIIGLAGCVGLPKDDTVAPSSTNAAQETLTGEAFCHALVEAMTKNGEASPTGRDFFICIDEESWKDPDYVQYLQSHR